MESQRLEILELQVENEDLKSKVDDLQGRLTRAEISADVDKQHLRDMQHLLNEMRESVELAGRERDISKGQAHRQQEAFEHEVQAAHHKLVELQRILTKEQAIRRSTQVFQGFSLRSLSNMKLK